MTDSSKRGIRKACTRPAWAKLATSLLLLSIVYACTGSEAPPTLDEALGFANPDDPAAVFDVRSGLNERTEALIVACMADLGFEYVPRELAVSEDPRLGGELTMEEYRRRFGYGMLSSWERDLRAKGEGVVDPNEQLLASVDEATRAAWQTALYGEDLLDDRARDGCQAEAEDEVNAYLTTDVWQELEPRLDELEARIAADSRTIEAQSNWADCMSEAGYRFRDEEEAIHYISDAVLDAWMAEPHPASGLLPTNRDSIGAWFVETETWAELIAMELDIVANADACSEDPQVRAEYEQRFLEEHADLLERLQEVR